MIGLDSDTRRAIAAAGLTQSDNDGEALNALRLVQRVLAKHGLTLQDIIRNELSSSPSVDPFGPTPAPMARPFEMRLTKPWQRDAIMLSRWPTFKLSEKEMDFVLSMKDRRTEPTEKQSAWLADLVAKDRREVRAAA